MSAIYLDYNATNPIAPEVAEAIRPCLVPGLAGASDDSLGPHG